MGVFDEGELRAEDFLMGGSSDGEAEWTQVSSDEEIFGLSW
jgi:hypothetical protein